MSFLSIVTGGVYTFILYQGVLNVYNMKRHYTTLLFFTFIYSNHLFAQHDYAKAQHLSTYFLGAQRCGDTKSWIHGACHKTDGQPVGKDLTGGWHDCGDYIKFHHTGPYTVIMNLVGFRHFPEAYPDNYSQAFSAPPANGIPDILDEVKIETDYLIKCVNGNTIYYQVGGRSDHNSFHEPGKNSSENLYNGSNIRTVYSATQANSNALGDGAAALALMSIIYSEYDQAYADECLTAAKKYYEIARINASSSADAEAFAYSWMSNSDYKDNLGTAAIYLYNATNQNSYLNDAKNYANSVSQWSSFEYGSIGHLLFFELYKTTGTTSYLSKVASKVNSYNLASCGYVHTTSWGSLRNASNAALLAALYHLETGEQDAYTFAKRNIDFILGTHGFISNDAPSNFSFLIGYNELGGGYPQHPHHAAAFGKSSNGWGLFSQESNNPGSVNFEHELTGGLAGGPESSCSKFIDNVGNYVSSEYCSYYNAAFTSATAYINKVENNIVTATSKKEDNSINYSYTNPVNENLKISGLDSSEEMEIYNSKGVLVEQIHVQDDKPINLSHLSTGIYFIKSKTSSWSASIFKQ